MRLSSAPDDAGRGWSGLISARSRLPARTGACSTHWRPKRSWPQPSTR